MNVLRRILFLILALIIIGISCCTLYACGQAVAGSPNTVDIEAIKKSVHLTPQEQNWLKSHALVRVRVGQWPPFMMSQKDISGISIEYLDVVSKVHGVEFTYLTEKEMSWPDTLNNLKKCQLVDMIPAIQPTLSRARYLAFSKVYQTVPWVIVTRDNANFIGGMADLQNQIVSVQKRFILQRMLRQNYPDIKLKIIDTPTPTLDSLKEVATGGSLATINALPVVSYFIRTYGLTNLKIAAPTKFKDLELAMGIRKDWPELASILNKTFSAMSRQDVTAINNIWLSPSYEYGFNPRTVLLWSGGLLLLVVFVIAFFSMWTKILRKKVADSVRALHKELNERKRAEKRAQTASRAKSEFLANMSHEIRTPLSGLVGMLQLMQTTPLNQEQKEYISNALLAGNRLTRLLGDILDLSRIEAGKIQIGMEPFDFKDTVDAIAQLFKPTAAEKRLDLKVQLDSSIPKTLIGDCTRLQQVLTNLVGNAIKFTEAGSVTISAHRLRQSDKDKAMILFSVSDTGIGIADKSLGTLFTPFTQVETSYTRKFQGAGLGLAISKRFVKLMGGTMTVESEKGKGSTFYFCLPLQISKQNIINNSCAGLLS